MDHAALTRLKVVDAAGTFVGTVSDVTLDPTTGRALGIIVHKGGFLGHFGETTTIAMAETRGVGTDIITVMVAAPAITDDTAPETATA